MEADRDMNGFCEADDINSIDRALVLQIRQHYLVATEIEKEQHFYKDFFDGFFWQSICIAKAENGKKKFQIIKSIPLHWILAFC